MTGRRVPFLLCYQFSYTVFGSVLDKPTLISSIAFNRFRACGLMASSTENPDSTRDVKAAVFELFPLPPLPLSLLWLEFFFLKIFGKNFFPDLSTLNGFRLSSSEKEQYMKPKFEINLSLQGSERRRSLEFTVD